MAPNEELNEALNAAVEDFHRQAEQPRPFVTLTYAQTLDGSISLERGRQLDISGDESRLLTHELRTQHDSILVGIGTVLADDPRLTAHKVQGEDPQPLILDSHLRFPENAKLFEMPKKPWIFTLNEGNREHNSKLEKKGAVLFAVEGSQNQIDLRKMLIILKEEGIKRVMVEGGAKVIASFLRSGLVDFILLTIAPSFVGGLKAVEERLIDSDQLKLDLLDFPAIDQPQMKLLGKDIILWGKAKFAAP